VIACGRSSRWTSYGRSRRLGILTRRCLSTRRSFRQRLVGEGGSTRLQENSRRPSASSSRTGLPTFSSKARVAQPRVRSHVFVDILSGSSYFIIETHSLPNAHSLLPSQLYLLCAPPVRSILNSYFLLRS